MGMTPTGPRRTDLLETMFEYRWSLKNHEDNKSWKRPRGLPVIEWSQVETQLADLLTHDDPRSLNRSTFWLTTLNADGSPHVTSVGALWHAGSCWFQTGERTRKARNLARDQRCTISVATKGFDVMVSGEARRVTDPTIVAEIGRRGRRADGPRSPTSREPASRHHSTRRCLDHRRGSCTRSKARTVTAVGTAEDTPGSMRWRF